MTEVGVDAILPWAASRSVVRWDAERAAKGVEKWRTVAREASKQSRRPWLPAVGELATTFAVADRIRAVVGSGGSAVVLHEAADRRLVGLAMPAAGERWELTEFSVENPACPQSCCPRVRISLFPE